MSNTENQSEILQYILDTKHALLTYVRSDLTPVSRAIGSFAPDGEDLFFSTSKESAKVQEIKQNRRVSFYFQHDNQVPERWTSLLLIGDAAPLSPGSPDYGKALERLAAKSPRFRERIATNDLGSAVIYKIKTTQFEYLDRSKASGPARKIAV